MIRDVLYLISNDKPRSHFLTKKAIPKVTYIYTNSSKSIPLVPQELNNKLCPANFQKRWQEPVKG